MPQDSGGPHGIDKPRPASPGREAANSYTTP
jgi:hypothetical protein